MEPDLSFPRRHARSQRFTLGRPRSFSVSDNGAIVLFLRSDAGDDPVHHLWALEVATGRERRLVDARSLGADETLTAEERARRERAREGGAGIVGYDVDAAARHAVFVLGGELWTVDAEGATRRVPTRGPAYDPRISRDGRRIAAVVDGGLHVGDRDSQLEPAVVEDGVRWGVADFVAAEEMQRQRGHWWDPAGERLLVCRVDDRDVPRWIIADPAHPERAPQEHRYPAAGTTNPDVSLWLIDLDGTRTEVSWDRVAYPYLPVVTWTPGRPPLLLVQTRDQRETCVLQVGAGGTTTRLRRDHDDAWIEIVPGVPTWAGDRLVTVADLAEHGDGGARALLVDGEPATPPGMQVRRVLRADDEEIWFTASDGDPTQIHVRRLWLAAGTIDVVTDAAGVHDAAVAGGTVVVASSTMKVMRSAVVSRSGRRHEVAATPLDPGIEPEVELLELGERRIRGALLRPAGDGPWPVLLDPYGGPHAQRVVRSRGAYLTPAWFADQGFAVLIADGRGTPGRGPAWERAVHRDLAGPVLEDQIAALAAAAELEPRLDLDHVGIRGWSFGGYLAALACLRRPDVFRAGVVGAPVTDWRLYDTHYTERYLGHPDDDPDAYRRSSVVDADGVLLTGDAPLVDVEPELLVIHGLADDNVVAAHSLRLSAALLAAGRPHAFLPLSGVTHMTPQEVVAENLLLVQRDFLRRVLAS